MSEKQGEITAASGEGAEAAREVTRREFMKGSSGAALAAGAGLAALQTGCASPGGLRVASTAPAGMAGGTSPGEQIRMGVIGCGSRGNSVLDDFMKEPEVRVIALCDPDSTRVNETAAKVEKKYGTRPATHEDYRELLENKDLDAVLIATPDHWHCLTFCHACEAGLDVYVEKPISHNILEGRAMVNAARMHARVAQVGTQQRSAPHFQEAVRLVRDGVIGPVVRARTWNYDYDLPDGLGMGTDAQPAGVNYDLWLGPAPLRPFNSNRFHYQWRWFFDYAGGMLCDWGIHLMDIALWGMKAEAPERISAAGSKYAIPDNRETPDTLEVTYQFGPTPVAPNGFIMTYTNDKVCALGTRGNGYGIEFHGEKGSVFVDRSNLEVVPQLVGPRENRTPLIEGMKKKGGSPTLPHVRNFLDCVKSRAMPISDIEIGHHSTATPHLGNIALRTGRRIRWDAATETILDDKEANELLGREYRKPWDKEARHLPLSRGQLKRLT